MNIGEEQINLIKKAKDFLKNLEFSNIDVSLSSFCYFNSWDKTPGYAKLKYWSNGVTYTIKFYQIVLKNIFAIFYHAKYIEYASNSKLKKYDVMFVSWSTKENFLSDGSYKDRYFNQSSKDLINSCWILISIDGFVPKNLQENIKILIKKKGIFKFNFFSIFKILIFAATNCKFSLKKAFHYFSLPSYFANFVLEVVKKYLKNTQCKAIILPYEGQPFQNYIFSEAKKYDCKIKTIGYVHSLITPLGSELIYRSGAPDLLLTHGELQKEILNTKLNWPPKRLFVVESFRYSKDEKKPLDNKIFLPLEIKNKSKLFLNELKNYLSKSSKGSFFKFDIINHPLMTKSKNHLYLKKKIEEMLKIYEDRFSDNPIEKKISVFLGVTATIFEALEKDIKVIHICSDPVFESHSEKIWPNLKVREASKYIFEYNLTLKGKYIIFGNKEKNLKNIVNFLYS